MTRYASHAIKHKNIKAKAEKKIQIAIDKVIDVIDMEVHYSVSQLAGEILDRLRELESKIQSTE